MIKTRNRPISSVMKETKSTKDDPGFQIDCYARDHGLRLKL